MTSALSRSERAALAMASAAAGAIRDLGEVPSGHLYARLMGHMDIHGYNAIVAALKGAGLVEEKNYLLRWVGPRL